MRTLFKRGRSQPFSLAGVAALALTLALPGQAEPALFSSEVLPSSLPQAFAAAWARQPVAAALLDQRSALAARRAVADGWTPEPPGLELGGRSDRFNRDRGANEVELGVAIPLWLPGEQRDSRALADAEVTALEGRVAALQWQLAGQLRAAWWDWQLAQEDVLAAQAAVSASLDLRQDVAKRLAVGDLAPTDLYQADGAVAQAKAEQIDAQSRYDARAKQLYLLAGKLGLEKRPLIDLPPARLTGQSEPAPSSSAPDSSVQSADWLARHPALLALQARAESARQTQALVRTRERANPELLLATRRERAATGEAIEQSWSLALRIPFSSGAQHRAAMAEAGAGRVEVEIELARERERLVEEVRLAFKQLESARQRWQVNAERARLAGQTAAAFAKAFRLGQSDLPTRLRVAQEASAAERALQRARIQQAAALSAYRQALGLLPE